MALDFHTRLIHELTALDKRQSTKRGYNPNALGIYFQAAENVTDAKSFANAFTPTRGMHTVAKKLGLPLDVERGDWVLLSEAPKKKNPMKKKKTKRKATPAQLRALAKGRATLKKKRGKKRVTRKKTIRRPSRVTHPKARAALRQPRNPVKPSSRASPHYAIKQGARFYDGSGFTKDKRDAAMWMNLNRCKRVAQKVADATGKACEIVH